MTARRLIPVAVAAALAAGASALAQSQPPPTTPTAPSAPTTPTAPTAPPRLLHVPRPGWGHGIGMSQYGARGRALAGWNERRILRAYFTSVRFAQTGKRTVRVPCRPPSRRRVWEPRAVAPARAAPDGRNVTPLEAGAT